MISRRGFTIGIGATAAGLAGVWPAMALPDTLAADLRRIEAESDGRLGVAVLDLASGTRAGHRADERFPMCSTFKLLAAAAILKRVDTGRDKLDRRIVFDEKHLVPYSPVTKERVGAGMTLAEICEAAVTQSDNTAGNLMLGAIGGPEGFTAFARTLGDTMTRLDRIETALNEASPGDERDTTTPVAMLTSIQKLVLGDGLSATSRDQLKRWLLDNKTGNERLRAGVPADWAVGDKTGSGDHGTTNDVAVFWPPARAPIIVTAYLTETKAPADKRNAVHAAVARAVVAAVR
jgi:beta-lactamase class A